MQTASRGQDGKSGLFKSALDGDPQPSFFTREGIDPLTDAFDIKITVHAGFGGRPLSPEKHAPALDRFLNRLRRHPSAIYVRVPFCENHCLYCGFFNRVYKPGQSRRYTDALLSEIRIWENQPAVRQGP